MDIFVLDYNKYIVDTLYLGNGSNSISEDKYIRYLKSLIEDIPIQEEFPFFPWPSALPWPMWLRTFSE